MPDVRDVLSLEVSVDALADADVPVLQRTAAAWRVSTGGSIGVCRLDRRFRVHSLASTQSLAYETDRYVAARLSAASCDQAQTCFAVA